MQVMSESKLQHRYSVVQTSHTYLMQGRSGSRYIPAGACFTRYLYSIDNLKSFMQDDDAVRSIV